MGVFNSIEEFERRDENYCSRCYTENSMDCQGCNVYENIERNSKNYELEELR
jgi:predicted Zn-dependent protease